MTEADITLQTVFAARQRLRGHIPVSPLRRSDWLSSVSGAEVWLKLESIQVTNSFKVRGAWNAVARLAQRDPHAALVTASAGNHGRAIAFAARHFGLTAIVFTPATAPDTKKSAIKALGAVLRDDAPDYDSAERFAREHAATSRAVYISPYNHPDVIAGAGTIGLEILDSLPDVDVVIVPLGGGGLASGVALTLKTAGSRAWIVGVEVEASRPFATSVAQGTITEVAVQPSLADGLIGNLEPGSITFPLVRQYVDRLTSISETELSRAMRGLACEEHLATEGAGATATAAALAGNVIKPGQRVVVLVTGSNVTARVLIAQLEP
jgi:threonine dehydratase